MLDDGAKLSATGGGGAIIGSTASLGCTRTRVTTCAERLREGDDCGRKWPF
jgi:hypothetical protein